MWTRKELKDKAKAGLKRNYWKAVLVGIIDLVLFGAAAAANGDNYGDFYENGLATMDPALVMKAVGILLAASLVIVIVSYLVKIFLTSPVRVGIAKFELEAVDGTAGIKAVGHGFHGGDYKNCVKTLFLRDLYVVLWSLLLIVPGVIKSLEYSQVEYLLAENPSLSTKEALERSKEMMNGNKWKYLVLHLSFIGWHLLSCLTLGLLNIFYVHPYQLLTEGSFYEAVRK